MKPIDVIYNVCCDALEIDLSSKCRTNEYAYGRFVFYKLCKENIKKISLSAIGKKVNRDHATVINGLKQYEEYINYRDFKDVDELCRDAMLSPVSDDEPKHARELRYLYSKIRRLNKQLKNERAKELDTGRFSYLAEILEPLTDEQLKDFINNRAEVYVKVNRG